MSRSDLPSPGSLTSEWHAALTQAQADVLATDPDNGEPLRHLFATLLSTVGVYFPGAVDWCKLWEEFRDTICLDLRKPGAVPGVRSPTKANQYDYGLHLIDLLLRETNKRLQDFESMPQPADASLYGTVPLQLHSDTGVEMKWSEALRKELNREQAKAFDAVDKAALKGLAKVFFLDGPAGTGKTHLYNCIGAHLKAQDHPALIISVAPTSTAATLLRGGRQADETFRVKLNGEEQLYCDLRADGHYASVIRRAHVLIWDEAGNQNRHVVEVIDKHLQTLRGSKAPFGGMLVLFGGDFRQLPPFVRGFDKQAIVEASMRRSYLWSKMVKLELVENRRLMNARGLDKEFGDWLVHVAKGEVSDTDLFKTLEGWNVLRESEDALLESVYANIPEELENLADYFGERSILAASNDSVREVNLKMLERIGGEESSHTAIDSVPGSMPQSDHNAALEKLNGKSVDDYLRDERAEPLKRTPPKGLRLKPGCPIILLHDLCPAGGLFNGSRAIVLDVSDRLLKVRPMGEDHQWTTQNHFRTPRVAYIPFVPLMMESSRTHLPFSFVRQQFPVDLAFSMTIAKAQGQAFGGGVGVDLRDPILEVNHGLFYVALSRARSVNTLHVLLSDQNRANGVIKNVVFPELLADQA